MKRELFRKKLYACSARGMTWGQFLKSLTNEEREYLVGQVKDATPPKKLKTMTEAEIDYEIFLNILITEAFLYDASKKSKKFKSTGGKNETKIRIIRKRNSGRNMPKNKNGNGRLNGNRYRCE